MVDIDERKVGWNCRDQKLIAMILMDDSIGEVLSGSKTFFRAYMVEDRKTGGIMANFRFRYNNREDNWFRVEADQKCKSRSEIVDDLHRSIIWSIMEALRIATDRKVEPPDCVHKTFWPPDDGGDPQKTIDWLIEQDLIELREVRNADGSLITQA